MKAAEPRINRKFHRILVLDDEEIIVAGLRETLVRAGYHVVTAGHPRIALEELQREKFSVIISDQCMPDMTGLEFFARVKELQPNASRTLITAVLSLDTVIEAINQGEIYRFIVKPWLREELLATVENAVQRYELITHNDALQSEALARNRELEILNESLNAQMARVAEQNQRLQALNQAQAENLEHSVQLGLHVMQTFHPALGNHARRVQAVCKAMADTLDLTAEERQALDISAWLHDIGLVGIHREVIRRWAEHPELLQEDELAAWRSHPAIGQELVRFVHHLENVGQIIRAHHERFDGMGFPDQLRGDEIPWLARLLGVAVGFSECNLEHAAAIEAVKLCSGSAYDPEAVRAFLRAVPRADVPRKEREVLLSELRPGMVLARGIYTANGLLLIPEGQLLSANAIGKLLNHNQVSPINQLLLVYC